MRKSKILAVILVAAMMLSPTLAWAGNAAPPPPGNTFGPGATAWVWAIFGCSSGIIFAALIANWQQNRPLTPNEAATCGLLFWFTPPNSIPGNPVTPPH